MNCPACSNQLTSVTVANLVLDYCEKGCGGIWFDDQELEKFDQEHESFPTEPLHGSGGVTVVVDHSKKRLCPKCPSSTLERKFYDSRKGFEVDTCPECKGAWLDTGELSYLRHENHDTEQREKKIQSFLQTHQTALNTDEIPSRVAAVFKLLFR